MALSNADIPFAVPDEARFAHSWMVAPQGSGKTTALENLIVDDLIKVQRNEASLFVMDSQNELIPRIAKMAAFAPGGVLSGKLVLLEPHEVPLALNIFDVGERSQEAFSLIGFVLTGLLGAEITSKQKGLFRYLIHAMLAIPDANVRTLKHLLTKDGYDRYRKHIIKIENEDVVEFFENRFNNTTFSSTKEELFWRVDAMLGEPAIAQLFTHPRNRLDLFKELSEAKVVVVNTHKDKLQGATETVGRFFIALLLQAAQRRMTHENDDEKIEARKKRKQN